MKTRRYALAAVAAMSVPIATPAHAGPAMPALATVVVPAAAISANSMSIAFDGEVFYYLSGNVLLRARLVATPGLPLTATLLPSITLPVQPRRIFYDARHRAMLLEETDLRTIDRFDLNRQQITAKVRAWETGAGQAYDWSTDRLYTIGSRKDATGTYQETLVTWDWRGRRLSSCLTGSNGESALVGSGDGTVYLQSEDDQTVSRVAPRCAERASFYHRNSAESPSEDDAIACDGVTFSQPAIWVRDAMTGTMSAYGLPSGRCVLPTRVRLRVSAGLACATLTRYELPTPLPHQPVALLGKTPLTDANGKACVAAPATPGRHTVRAAFAGTPAWAASAATATYEITPPPVAAIPPPAVAVVAPAHPPVLPAAPAAPAHAPAPAPHVAPHAAVAQAVQPAYGTASATQSVPVGVAVPQVEEQAQLAYAHERHREGPPYGQLYAVSVLTALAVVLADRYRTATVGRR